MRVLLISTSVLPLGFERYGGVEKLVSDWSEALAKHGQDVTVAAPIGSKVPDGVKLVETVKLPEEQDNDNLALQRLDENSQHEWINYDAAHDFSHGHVLGNADENLPVVSMLYDPVVYRYRKSPYNIVCLSNWQRERFERLYGQKAIVMPMWVNTDKFKPTENPTRRRFLFIGKISAEKGVHVAINMAKTLDAELDVVGGLIPSENNPQNQYLNSIRVLCANDLNIKFHFNVTEDEKINFLQNAKAVIYPVQQDEAHWLAGMEAWCVGTPTIALNRGAMGEITSSTWGLVPANEGAFLSLMRGFENNPFWFPTDWKSAHKQFGVHNLLPKWISLYEKVAKGKRW